MGNICNSNSESHAAKSRNKRIEELNRKAFNEESQKIKLLLLGAGESGKSTLFKQMKILYGSGDNKGFTSKERKEMKSVVYQNVLYNLKQLLCSPELRLVPETNGSPLSPEILQIAEDILKTSTRDVSKFTKEFGNCLIELWKDENIMQAWNNRSKLQVQDALAYYLSTETVERLVGEDYIPTDQDILRSRVRTSGIVEEQFVMDGSTFVMVDVGGQRNERRKWIHAFEDVECILFVAAISEYDQSLFEDNSVSRQKESVELFGKVSNEKTFENTGLVLFLNKSDLFRQKLLTIPFRYVSQSTEDCPSRNLDYTGAMIDSLKPEGVSEEEFDSTDVFEEIYQQSLMYLENLYKKQVPTDKAVFVKTTCATDTKQVEHIMNACKEIFVRKSLKNGGFM